MSSNLKRASSSVDSADPQAQKKTKPSNDTTHTSLDDSDIIPTKLHYASVFVKNMAKSRKFFQDVLGFKSTSESDNWDELTASESEKFPGASKIALHGWHEQAKEGSVQLGFFVKNLTKFHDKVSKLEEVRVIDAPQKQPWGGLLATYKHEDGLVFFVIEAVSYDPDAKPTAEVKASTEVKTTSSEKGCGLCHLEIPAGDLERAKKFYEIFGWTFTAWGTEYMMFKTHDDTYKLEGGFMLQKDTNKRFQHVPANFLNVKSIDEYASKIEKAGGTIVMPKTEISGTGAYQAHFKDTEGNLMAMYQASSHSSQ